ncbi:MAG: hypothetical protein ABSB14_02520 [Candidatus Sulfotelmatobacter sp.]
MPLHSQDVVVLLKLIANRDASKRWTYAELGKDLFMSPSQVFRSIERTEKARLLVAPLVPTSRDDGEQTPGGMLWPNNNNLKEFLIHGVKYAFPVERGGPTRGIPTAEATGPLNRHLQQDFPLPPVWPYAEGHLRGIAFSPLHKNVPQAALQDSKLYELLALVDAIREGRAREREIAIRELTARIDSAKVDSL